MLFAVKAKAKETAQWSPGLAIFCGSSAYLSQVARFPGAHHAALLSPTERNYESAVNALNERLFAQAWRAPRSQLGGTGRRGCDGLPAATLGSQMTVAQEINTLYTCAASASVRAIAVDSELVNQFCRWHQSFQRAANENEGDLLLHELVRLSFQLWYRVLSAPLPLCHPSLIDASAEDLLLKRVHAVGQSYCHLREVSERYASALTELRSSDDNPLWLAIEPETFGRQVDNVGLLIKPARLVAAVRDFVTAQRRPLEVLMESQLRRAVAFDRLYVFGAGRWYPGFVFSAPRATGLQIVRYRVLSDSPPEEATFVKPLKRSTRTLFAPSDGRQSERLIAGRGG